MISDNNYNSFNFYLRGVETEKEQILIIRQKKIELNELIRNISWRDLKVHKSDGSGNSFSYEFTFPQVILQKVNEIKTLYQPMNHLADVGKDILFGDEKEDLDWAMQVDVHNRRVHIPGDGISITIRGLGLGCKMYRAILEHVPFVSSEDHELSAYGKIVWDSLRKSPLFYTFYRRNRGFCFASDKNPNEILRVLEEQISPENFDEMLWDEDFVLKNKSLIVKSPLKVLLK